MAEPLARHLGPIEIEHANRRIVLHQGQGRIGCLLVEPNLSRLALFEVVLGPEILEGDGAAAGRLRAPTA